MTFLFLYKNKNKMCIKDLEIQVKKETGIWQQSLSGFVTLMGLAIYEMMTMQCKIYRQLYKIQCS